MALIGRDNEISVVKERLLRKDIRLITLTGMAGVGKTSLALAVTDELRQVFTQINFVDLSALAVPAQVFPSIARSFGVIEGNPNMISEQIAGAIGARPSLLVLDNCEHVLAAMPELSSLINACRHLKVLATSREILNLKCENVFPVPPLQVPELDSLPSINTLAQIPAVNLFIQRARFRDPGFTLTDKNYRAVAELSVHLDGLPLAIELAAPYISLLGPKNLLAHLIDRLDFLVDRALETPVRHRTLRAAIDWSYDLLSRQEQCLFRSLSVFAGGCTIQAVERVCVTDGLKASELLPSLERLVSRSLVSVQEQPDGGMRYRLLETTREYARARLQAAGEEEYLRKLHRDWFLAWAEQGEPNLWGPGLSGWLDQIEADFGNIWAALEWSHTRPDEAEAGLRLWAALSRFWDIRGHVSEGLTIIIGLLLLAPQHTIARARSLMEAVLLAERQADWAGAQTMAEECRTFALDLGDILDASAALMAMGIHAQAQGNFQQAAAFFEEALTLTRSKAGQEPRALYMALLWQGRFASFQGDHQSAVILLEEALSLAKRQGDPSFVSIISVYWGRAVLGLGEIERATKIILAGLRACQAVEYREIITISLDFLGQAAWARKEYSYAVLLLGTAAELRSRIGVVHWDVDHNYEQIMAAVRTDLGEDALMLARASAQKFSFNEAVSWVLSPEALQRSNDITSKISKPTHLSARELEVAGLIARGYSNRLIAPELQVSKRTVDTHVRHILNKLGIHSRSQIAVWYSTHHPSFSN